jgi:hypothetical protein
VFSGSDGTFYTSTDGFATFTARGTIGSNQPAIVNDDLSVCLIGQGTQISKSVDTLTTFSVIAQPSANGTTFIRNFGPSSFVTAPFGLSGNDDVCYVTLDSGVSWTDISGTLRSQINAIINPEGFSNPQYNGLEIVKSPLFLSA